MIQGIAFVCTFSIVMVLSLRDAAAVDPLSTEELSSHCTHYSEDPNGKDAIFCIRYIQGFVDGAVTTDKRVAMNVAAEYDREESYSERAIRTRAGRQLARYGPSFYAEFCLGAPVSLKEVAEKIIEGLVSREVDAGQPFARSMVYQTLREEYPCEENDEK